MGKVTELIKRVRARLIAYEVANPYHALTFYFSFFLLLCISAVFTNNPFIGGMLIVSVPVIFATWKLSANTNYIIISIVSLTAVFVLTTFPNSFTSRNLIWLLSYSISLFLLSQFIAEIKTTMNNNLYKEKDLAEEICLWKLRFETLERQNKKLQEKNKEEIALIVKLRNDESKQIFSLRELIDVSHEESLRVSKDAHKLTKEKEHLLEEMLLIKQKILKESKTSIVKKRPAQKKSSEGNQTVFETLREASQRKQKNDSISLTDLAK